MDLRGILKINDRARQRIETLEKFKGILEAVRNIKITGHFVEFELDDELVSDILRGFDRLITIQENKITKLNIVDGKVLEVS